MVGSIHTHLVDMDSSNWVVKAVGNPEAVEVCRRWFRIRSYRSWSLCLKPFLCVAEEDILILGNGA